MSATFTYSTCRKCLGDGCIHCNHRGQFRTRLWSAADREAAARRKGIFGETGRFQAQRQENERTLAFLKAVGV